MNEFVIVGGGVHGTYLANRATAEYDPEDITIVDPAPRLLSTFRQRAARCGMTELRSPFVHHLGRDPFDLETFAHSRGREAELVPTPNYPPRPTLSLFCDHAAHVIARRGLDALHRRGTVTDVRDAGDGLVVETTGGTLRSRRVVLAVGHGPPSLPEWAGDAIDHVWDDAPNSGRTASPRAVAADGGNVVADGDGVAENTNDKAPDIVVGGGSTAAQVALQRNADILLSRHPLRTSVTEAEPPWVNWPHIQRELHGHPPGSKARLKTVREARKSGTIRPQLRDRLEASDVSVVVGEVESAVETDDAVRLRLTDGRPLAGDAVCCATGFEPPWDRPFVRRLASSLGLERGYDGMPVLDDATVSWRGDTDGIYASGALAAGTVGPFAGNVIGARRAADRIVG
ncbi:uncharacterized protein NP_0226A [Natronomonas pharaonis DSM 2160]|uniref:FAD-dependent urate hydroxylase HpyO/Asp monooxygenase CreE-like FAD/NAD(P)-binding domain-containing protein n=1 Tax=Natronomonas pharaonis (strain ATCC 35678 / DSM 2160 / CIP 103997 / JCM 8858 / NBRC 14720 / NCIMB 2260 / Gabara) TaxID=348780 RepID=A0A1U7ETI3_NATPD|nr:FAD/NAD(P)-binding protein [Natronomonas pharaonis]CAI48204.1 uncharacterized protein NP_0226A [Natronomonas pharaonis DSM 2160]